MSLNDIIADSDALFDINNIVTIEADLNGDELMDYWVLYPSLQCTSTECWGHVYFRIKNGYCFAGKGMKETDLNYGRHANFTCKHEDK